MTRNTVAKIFAAPTLALLMLGGCATPFNANVARFQQLPPAQGQSFTVVAEDPHKAGSLEFAHYADLVAAHLAKFGYTAASDPASAALVVRLDYSVDQGQTKVQSTGFGAYPYGYGYGGGFYGAGYYGFHHRYRYGFYDPFLFGPGYSDVSSYTVYGSTLKLRIDKAGSGQSVFDGTARAQSLSNHLTYLVPNLVDAMFTGFPGNNGEDVKVTVAPEPKK